MEASNEKLKSISSSDLTRRRASDLTIHSDVRMTITTPKLPSIIPGQVVKKKDLKLMPTTSGSLESDESTSTSTESFQIVLPPSSTPTTALPSSSPNTHPDLPLPPIITKNSPSPPAQLVASSKSSSPSPSLLQQQQQSNSDRVNVDNGDDDGDKKEKKIEAPIQNDQPAKKPAQTTNKPPPPQQQQRRQRHNSNSNITSGDIKIDRFSRPVAIPIPTRPKQVASRNKNRSN